MNQPSPAAWHVVVPVKGVVGAKTRLAPPHGVDRGHLAVAMALDTLESVCRVISPERVHVVTADAQFASAARELGTLVVADPADDGLLGAIGAGLHSLPSGSPTAVLLGDLPALRADELAAALAAAEAHPRAFVPDRHGTGTVLITGAPGIRLIPHFGTDSAAAHETAGHVRLDLPLPTLRTDVDLAEDLAAVLRMGTGRHTAALLGAAIDETA
jgi:2-phospho-L-lactate guanylyltransferase